MSRRRSRTFRSVFAGFTLVELLVVIAIIGILIALLLPAIQAAREAARRAMCQNHVKNLALAVSNYESSKRGLPPTTDSRLTGEKIANLYQGSQLSWIVRILPYIEEQPLYSQFKFGPTDNAFNQDATLKPEEALPAVLLCPSDSARGRFYASAAYSQGKRFAKANYVAYVSPEHIVNMRVYPGAMINELQPVKRITDGASNTLMLTEVRTRAEEADERGAWVLAWNGSSIISFDMHSSDSSGASILTAPNQRNAPYIPKPNTQVSSLPPNSPPTTPSTPYQNDDKLRECPDPSGADLENMSCGQQTNTTFIVAAPRSMHPGGVYGANVDGSVAWLSNDIDEYLMARRVSINDGQLLTEGYSR